MKLKNIFWGLILVIAFNACDVITNPVKPKETTSVLPTTSPNYIDSSATSGAYSYKNYKVLLEDCMGDLCGNCPSASQIGDTLISPTGGYPYGQIVMMEDNMGGFAVPDPAPGPDPPTVPANAFATDYRCVASNAWCILFGLTTSNYPVGLINRYGWNASAPNMDVNYGGPNGTIWQDSIKGLISGNPSAIATIDIHDSCWTSPRIIGATFKVTFNTALPSTNSYYLETVICEDHIISWQKDLDVLFGWDSTYDHRNVLRGAFGNNTGGLTTGVAIPASVSSTAGGTWTSFQTYDFTKGENGNAANWKMANCYIVAFVYNQATQAVVQAEMIKVE